MRVSVRARSGCLKRSPTSYGTPFFEYAAMLAGYGFIISPSPHFSAPASPFVTMIPSLARPTAGSTRRVHWILPYFLCASAKPATVPGTPTDLWLS
jgi:hypothetical protein